MVKLYVKKPDRGMEEILYQSMNSNKICNEIKFIIGSIGKQDSEIINFKRLQSKSKSDNLMEKINSTSIK